VQITAFLHYADNQRNQFKTIWADTLNVFPEKIAPWPTFSKLDRTSL